MFSPPDDAFAPLTTELPILVLPARSPAAPGRALDLALADPAFIQWLAAHPVKTWPTRPSFVYRPETSDFMLAIEGAEGARLVATIANDGRGPVMASGSVDPSFEPEPTSSP